MRMRKLPRSESLLIDGPAGVLEAMLESPQEHEPLGCAVVCHPHPVHGGTMQNKVAHTLARSFVGQNMQALRFNFRGVGNPGEFARSHVIAAQVSSNSPTPSSNSPSLLPTPRKLKRNACMF